MDACNQQEAQVQFLATHLLRHVERIEGRPQSSNQVNTRMTMHANTGVSAPSRERTPLSERKAFWDCGALIYRKPRRAARFFTLSLEGYAVSPTSNNKSIHQFFQLTGISST